MTDFHYQVGLPQNRLAAAVQLYDEACGAPLALAVPHELERRRLLVKTLRPEYAVAALDAEGVLVGVAGLHTADGSLTGGLTARELVAMFGPLNGARITAVFSLTDRASQDGILYLHGIAVNPARRGQGIGSGLLGAVKEYGRDRGYCAVSVDVSAGSRGARRLYEREGFTAVKTAAPGYLRRILGLGAATTLHYPIAENRP